MKKLLKILSVIVLMIAAIYIVLAVVYNDILIPKTIEQNYKDCEVIRFESVESQYYDGMFNRGWTGKFYRDYVVYDSINSITFNLHYIADCMFPYFMPISDMNDVYSNENRNQYNIRNEKYKELFHNVVSSYISRSMLVEDSYGQLDNGYSYIWFLNTPSKETLISLTSSFTETVIPIEDDVTVTVVFISDSDLFDKCVDNASRINSSNLESKISSLIGRSVTKDLSYEFIYPLTSEVISKHVDDSNNFIFSCSWESGDEKDGNLMTVYK